jgi:dihydrofolate reductase
MDLQPLKHTNNLCFAGIVAISCSGVIGVTQLDGKQVIPWNVPEDLARFQRLTSGCPLIMGRNTFDSLPHVLPGRKHFVITRNRELISTSFDEDQVVYTDMDCLYEKLETLYSTTVFVIGGSQIFNYFTGLCDKWYLTMVHTSRKPEEMFKATHYFQPPIELFHKTFALTHCSELLTSRGRDNLQYEFWDFERDYDKDPSNKPKEKEKED